MKTNVYDVQIEAIVTKTIRVNAVDEDAAYDLAHEIFTVACTGNTERLGSSQCTNIRYEENTLNIFKVEEIERETA